VKLYLIRHAVACVESPDGTDARRALTSKGSKRFLECVEGLDRLGVRFDAAWTSPLLRAVETTELLLPLCRHARSTARARLGTTRVCAELAEAPGESLLAALTHAEVDRLACVGHEPHLSRLAAWLVTGWRASTGDDADEERAGGGFELDKGGVLALEGEPRPGRMRLVASYPPSALRKLSRR